MANTLPVASMGSNEPLMVEVISSKDDTGNPILQKLDQISLVLMKGFSAQIGEIRSLGKGAGAPGGDSPVDPLDPTDTGGGETTDDPVTVGLIQRFRESISAMTDAIADAGGNDIKSGFNKLGQGLGVLGPIVSVAKDLFEKVTGVLQIVKGVGSLIVNSIGGAFNFVKGLFGSNEEKAKEENTEATEEHTEATVEATEAMHENIKLLGKAGDDETKERNKMTKGFNKFNMGLVLVIAAIMAILFAINNNLFGALGRIAKDIATKGGEIGRAIKNGIDDSVKAIKDGATKLRDKFAKTADDVAKGLQKRFPQATEKVKAAATKVKDVVKGGIEKGKSFFQRVGSGIKNAAGGVIDKVKTGVKTVAEKASKAGSVIKGAGKALIKRLPLVGALVEGGIDANDNAKMFAAIKEAYENNAPIVPVDPNNPESGTRPLTEEEFKEQEQIYKASIAGSTGKAAGSFGGAAGGAALGASIGSVIPVVGTIAGGIIGAVIGGWFGGKAGDKAATEIAEAGMGVDNVNELDASIVSAAKNYMNSEQLESANAEIADAKVEGGGTSVSAPTVIDQSSTSLTESYSTGQTSMTDGQMGYSSKNTWWNPFD